MDREANLPLPSVPPPKNLVRPVTNAADTTSSSSSFSSSSSPPDFLRHVQAAFKRHRPLGIMQTNNSIKPRRTLIPQREASRTVASNVDPNTGTKKSQDVVPLSKDSILQTKNPVAATRETHEDASPFPGTITKTFDESFNPLDGQREQPESVIATKEDNQVHLACVESQLVDGKRKVQFLTVNKATSQEMEWDVSNQVEVSNVINDEMKQQNFQNMESDVTSRSDGAVTSLAKRAMVVQDQLHQLRNFLNQPATQSSVGPSCATTTSVHSTSAPMLNSTTYCSRLHTESGSQAAVEPLRDSNANSLHATPRNLEQLSHPLLKDTSAMLIDMRATATQPSTSAIHSQFKELNLPKEQKGSMPEAHDIANNPSLVHKPAKERGPADDGTDVQSQRPMSRNPSSNVKLEPSKPENKEKVASSKGTSIPRKRSYDPDLFFKVNGKLYQRLGKIGSGGSSEVHKVISSDCTIYALKKIKLKGRDYGTAYGFCQEILYLNKLKGKNNIIQLIDYEVTDKALLHEVMSSSISNKDGRVKDDGCIYMVLEYGEIDLAHMLAQKWKEMDSSNQTINENWLRFYWQQILQAVNTIHEERIVHSDLKPANFLLVKGSLKLIDFGIAKAIMNDTTNIQRDSQVGTLSYMSPEAFMCNESDANGNTIKCGRPSDIWSLGCILYQMVYGRTPFSEFKTFWAKFKVITDPNHEITYEPVSNPWLLDLMKKCLAWDRNERWRIPQLLQHPFLVPPVPTQPSVSQKQGCKLLQLVSETCSGDQEASVLCRELQQLLNPGTLTPESLTSRDQQCKLLSQMSKLCFQLRECLAKLERG
ncbi:serine/threonine-protein kinase MPS1 isoform X2 [Populus alba]|uniref:Serine/threonine-protein kinase MPS1 isoform X2 n=2 Tax=Populus TaxID=3689 RepID=A0AAD6WBJ4_9ROSI|nr:serine/threonine-protein kinase MPS1 isoform X2 [Populus alba]KAJ7006698.1 serine/threonine-protein kinase MPS1 isoform X2 [Populus alba x Populus x berolinensis]TKS13997.1 putative serine/threonine-protein kinase mps1 isoform X2 [Populus alba]